MILTLSLFLSSLLGVAIGLFTLRQYNRQIIRKAQEDAQEILNEAQEILELRKLEEKEKSQEIELDLWSRSEPELLKYEEKISELQSIADEKKQRFDSLHKEFQDSHNSQLQEIKKQESVVHQKELHLQEIKQSLLTNKRKFSESLSERTHLSIENVKNDIIQKMVSHSQKRCQESIEDLEEYTKTHSENLAKRLLSLIIDRFARPYCPERGIGSVNFPDAHAKKLFCDSQGLNIKAVQEYCGCDIIIEDNMDFIGVAGFDPVRRELTRRSLERILKERKNIQPSLIKKIAEQEKSRLFQNIKSDGDAIARELKLDNLHPEIKQMMGSLRYRYSFTQNQYFHCSEVGWLAGLMASELRLEIRKARRCGMLHDLGKSMDHMMDGGHAMIGADFIETRGESDEIVHAVRSHHFDVQPNSDYAFLVIAADAISGARPGARRSTIESYNQKVNELQEIARSFEGVTDCFILNGGRECRVSVNSKNYDDQHALELSKKIASQIEADCNYPGQIKVVVVRETQAFEYTKKELA